MHVVLIVEDDADIRATMCEALEDNGYKAVVERYNWQHTSQELIALYNSLTSRPSHARASHEP